MIPDETPDYSELSLREMRSLAQRMNRTCHATNYAYLLRAIEKREAEHEAEIAARPKKVSPPFYRWIFETENKERNSTNILDWWAQRFSFWIYYVTVFYFSSVITAMTILGYSSYRKRAFPIGQYVSGTFGFLVFALIPWAFCIVFVSVAFWFAASLDCLFQKPLRFLGWRLSVGVFSGLLALTIVLAAWPVVVALIGVVFK